MALALGAISTFDELLIDRFLITLQKPKPKSSLTSALFISIRECCWEDGRVKNSSAKSTKPESARDQRSNKVYVYSHAWRAPNGSPTCASFFFSFTCRADVHSTYFSRVFFSLGAIVRLRHMCGTGIQTFRLTLHDSNS